MVSHPRIRGGVAQLGEHLPCKQGVRSSILLVSTIFFSKIKFRSLGTSVTKTYLLKCISSCDNINVPEKNISSNDS